jgi:alkyl sulfatase BDS1-like metallo-beta-lactamase superfamily hydrolase
MTLDTYLDFLAIRLNGPKAAGRKITINLDLTDTGEQVVLFLANGALNHSCGRQDADADATVTVTRPALDDIILGVSTFDESVAGGALTVTGDLSAMTELVSLLDIFDFWFNIVTP